MITTHGLLNALLDADDAARVQRMVDIKMWFC